MANVLSVPDAYADVVASLIAAGRTTVPVVAIDSSSLSPTWATVLAVGDSSSGTSPIISAGDGLVLASVGVLTSASGAIELRHFSGGLLSVAASTVEVGVPSFGWSSLVSSPVLSHAGSGGETMTIRAQDGGGLLHLRGGDGTTSGGGVLVEGMEGDSGGDIILRAGGSTGGGTDGSTILQLYTGATAISIGSGGLAFWSGSRAVSPSVTGSRSGNLALASLLSALDSMGLITDNTFA
jgi:hypothetical protein